MMWGILKYKSKHLYFFCLQKAVMKIDIEGHEHKAFAHAMRLLKEIYVPFIFMEWMKLREYYGAEVMILLFLKFLNFKS